MAAPGIVNERPRDAVRPVPGGGAVESEHRSLPAEYRRFAAGKKSGGIVQRVTNAGEQLRQLVRRAAGTEIFEANRRLAGKFDRPGFRGERPLALPDEPLPS